jgi:peptide/nickel transport system ATP-binding protein/oligopeptide transport system ATP-binding protein
VSAALQVEDLRVSFGSGRHRVDAVSAVSFALQRGETLALVGESGAGKSTVANTILGLVRGAQGRILLDGVDLLDLGRSGWRAARRDVQIVFQDPYESLTPRMTVGELVSEPLRLLGGHSRATALEEARRLLPEVELAADYLDRYPAELSGGEAQRVAIARAIAIEPKVVVLDEPTSALDANVRAAILALLSRIQKRHGSAFLLVTHDLASVRRLAQRVAVMYGGKVLELGETATVLAQPAHPYTRALLAAAMPEADSAADDFRLPAEGAVGERGCTLAPRCPWSQPSCLELETPISSPYGSEVLCDVPAALPFTPVPQRSSDDS